MAPVTEVPRPVVLVVEDDSVNQRLLADICRAEGYDVVTADDGDAAWELSCSGGFDLILMDVSMPGRDGLAVCRQMRERGDVPVILLSASTEPGVRQHAMEAGATSFVAKPFRVYELARHMRSALVSHRSPSEPPTLMRRSQRRRAASALGRVAGAVDLRVRLRKESGPGDEQRACLFFRVTNEREVARELGRHAADAVLGAVSERLAAIIGEQSVFWSESNELVGVMGAELLPIALESARQARAGWRELQLEGVVLGVGAVRYRASADFDVDLLLREGRLAAEAKPWDGEPIEVRILPGQPPVSSHP